MSYDRSRVLHSLEVKPYDHTKDIREVGNEYRWVCPFCHPAFVEMMALPYSLTFLMEGVERHIRNDARSLGWHEWS